MLLLLLLLTRQLDIERLFSQRIEIFKSDSLTPTAEFVVGILLKVRSYDVCIYHLCMPECLLLVFVHIDRLVLRLIG